MMHLDFIIPIVEKVHASGLTGIRESPRGRKASKAICKPAKANEYLGSNLGKNRMAASHNSATAGGRN